MSSYPPNASPESIGSRIEETIQFIETEVRRTVAYINNAVVPQIRSESITAMRTAADKLRELADRFEQQGGPRR